MLIPIHKAPKPQPILSIQGSMANIHHNHLNLSILAKDSGLGPEVQQP